MSKHKPLMQQQLRWLEDLEQRLTIIHQGLVMMRVAVPGLDDTCEKLGDIVHEIRNKRTVAQNWRAVAEQDGFTKDD